MDLEDDIMQHFSYANLPNELAGVSSQFMVLAKYISMNLPRCPERTVALRKLLEAKDAAVRAKVKPPPRDAIQ